MSISLYIIPNSQKAYIFIEGILVGQKDDSLNIFLEKIGDNIHKTDQGFTIRLFNVSFEEKEYSCLILRTDK